MSSKFIVTKLATDDPVFDSEDAAIEAAKAKASAEPGAMFFVCDQDDTVVVPKPDPVVTKVE